MDKQYMIEKAAALRDKLYYEDTEVFYKMIQQFAEKKGIQ